MQHGLRLLPVAAGRATVRLDHGLFKWPAADRVKATVSARLRKADSKGELIDRLTVAGHGEPTLHPAFQAIVVVPSVARAIRVAPALRLAILSKLNHGRIDLRCAAGWRSSTSAI